MWRTESLCLFWTVWKARNKIAFEDEVPSIQNLKSCVFFWSKNKLCIKDGPSTLVGFINWLVS